MCSRECLERRKWHTKEECEILGRCHEWPKELRLNGFTDESNAYAVITPLRMLLHKKANTENWLRTNQLMDHEKQRRQNSDEWGWYQRYIVEFFRNQLKLDCFSEDEIHRYTRETGN